MYSFGIVVWEILTRKVPWRGETEALEIFRRVVIKEERPDIPEEAPSYLVDIMRSCWAADPNKRPSFDSVQESLDASKGNGLWVS